MTDKSIYKILNTIDKGEGDATKVRCSGCAHFWHHRADESQPYDEFACLKLDIDLWGDTDEEEHERATNCPHFQLIKPQRTNK